MTICPGWEALHPMDIGWCDSDGTVHCGLCEWKRRCTTAEEAEFRFVEHAREAHGKTTVLRRDPDTGEATELTDPE